MGGLQEHLFFDKECLLEANRVLKKKGRLIITVPYHDSNDDFHVRMHDLTTITHLIHYANFKIIDNVERPGVFFKSYLNHINAVLAVLMHLAFKINIYTKLVPIYGEMEYFFGKKNFFRSFLKSMNIINYGGAICLIKNNESSDSHLKHYNNNIKYFKKDRG